MPTGSIRNRASPCSTASSGCATAGASRPDGLRTGARVVDHRVPACKPARAVKPFSHALNGFVLYEFNIFSTLRSTL
ncbi:hypothetical protein BLAT2472_10543 [Burkholderia latens]